MTEIAVHLQPGYLLRHWPYRETSLIIDVLTRDFGRISLLAKGVRKPKSKTAGLLQPFNPLQLSFKGKSELKTLTHVELLCAPILLQGLPLCCGFYFNELIAHFLQKLDPHPEVYDLYQACLRLLPDTLEMEGLLRTFELELLEWVGYGLQLERDCRNNKPVEASKSYCFDVVNGPFEAIGGDVSGKTLMALKSKKFTDPGVMLEAKKIMRAAIDFHFQGKVVKSRAVVAKIIKRL